MPPVIGDVLWTPPADVRETTEIGRYLNWLRDERGRDLADYDALWRWSVDDLEGFWGSVWDFFGVRAHAPYERVLAARQMPGAEWFPGARLNYAEHALGTDEDADRVAVVARSQTREPIEVTFGELRDQVARARAGLRRLGVGPGDRVVAYLPNIPETLVAFLATASLGATWAACAPEFGARSVLARFGQIEPKVLLAIGGYTYRDRPVDRREQVAEIRAGLPTIEHVVHVAYGEQEVPDAVAWDDLLAGPGEPGFEPVPFDHPVYVLFSSGTTGLPKAIVHGHGGQLIEHLKGVGLGWDLKPGARLLWFSTTAWMMWNALVSALLVRASIVMIDGDPMWPDPSFQWRLAEETRPSFMGVAPTFLMACRKADLQLGRDYDLSSIRALGFAGSPLPSEGYHYVYDQLGPDVLCLNGSGGTDICGAFVSGSFLQPVYDGEISGCCLGADVKAFDADANVVVGELGEMVVAEPMPSMPVRLWNDPDGERYLASYFNLYPGVWRQGDWILFTERGSCVITGRSDATLNRGGVRMGTSELYAVVEELPEVADSLIVHREDDEGGAGELILFVALDGERELDDELRGRIAGALRSRALAAPRAGLDRRGAGGPAHDDRQEARGAGQAHPARRARRRRRQRRRAAGPDRDRGLRRLRGGARLILAARHLGAHERRHLGAEELHGAQHVAVLDRADAHLADVALVAEELVLEEDLLGDLLGRARGHGAARRAQRLVLRAPGGRPAALAPDAVHHRQVGRGEGRVGLGGGRTDEGVGVDRNPGLLGLVAGGLRGLAVEVDEWHEALGLAADDREDQRQAERACADDRLRRAADGDPHGQLRLRRARPDARVVERRAVTARPRDVDVVAQPEQQVELLGVELVVVLEVVAEEREGLDERAAAGHDLGAAAREQVDLGEVLEDTDRIVGAEHGDGAREADALGGDGRRGQRDGRRGDEEVLAVVLADGEDVEAELVGQLHLLHEVAHALLGGDARAEIGERGHSEFHVRHHSR